MNQHPAAIRSTVIWNVSSTIHAFKLVITKLLISVVIVLVLSALLGPNIDISVVAVTTAVAGAAIDDELAVAFGRVFGVGE